MERPPVPRIVRPRSKTTKAYLPIIVIDTDLIFVERLGEVVGIDQLATLTAAEPSSLVVAQGIGWYLNRLNDAFQDNPRWQFRLTPVLREFYKPNREQVMTIGQTVISFYGFTGENKKPGRYHYPIDPVVFIRKTIHELRDTQETRMEKLLEWGVDVRKFLKDHDLPPKPTAGGIAGLLLRDKRFYPKDRRKVPMATNDSARPTLPGNHYELFVEPERYFKATYFDQSNAHHAAAQSLTFPHADKLNAKGYFHSMEDMAWAKSGTKRFDRAIAEHGLFLVKLSVPHLPDTEFPLPFMKRQGSRLIFIYSNELEDVRKLGGRIEYIVAAWTSPVIDEGLSKYAKWAENQVLDCEPLRKSWLKPMLLASYGILAATPRRMKFGYRTAKNSEIERWPVGSGLLEVQTRETEKVLEVPVASVIHRGMIEAETRLRSIQFARELSTQGFRVLAIYADSVFIESTNGDDLPLLPTPWRIQTHLNGLQFWNSTSFTSRELTKLPGVSREQRGKIFSQELLTRRTNGSRVVSKRLVNGTSQETERSQ